MARVTKKAWNALLQAANGREAALKGYRFLRSYLPAAFRENSPYRDNDALYSALFAQVDGDSVWAGVLLSTFDAELCGPDGKVHIGYSWVIKAHQLRKICKLIEDEFPDECSEILEYLDFYPNHADDEAQAWANDVTAAIREKQ